MTYPAWTAIVLIAYVCLMAGLVAWSLPDRDDV